MSPQGGAFSKIVAALVAKRIDFRRIDGPGGSAIILPDCARIVALAFAERDDNLFWHHPSLLDPIGGGGPVSGGLGGERLWFGPEIDYFWQGEPQWQTFANYHPPMDIDPGNWEFTTAGVDFVDLGAEVVLPLKEGSAHLRFHLDRRIQMVSPPEIDGMRDAEGVMAAGLRISHRLILDDSTRAGRVDLWQIVQLPAASTLVVPLNGGGPPLGYSPNSGKWRVESDHISWPFTGTESAKFGLSTAGVTGRAGTIGRLADGRCSLVIRDFDVCPGSVYCDHPYDVPRSDQVFQAWDGFGFGEMEVHSRALDAASGERSLSDETRIWAFAGDASTIVEIGRKLLGIEINTYV